MPANILIVDDDRIIRELLRLHLAGAGYDVQVAEDAIAAGYEVLRRAPDLIICDINMPHLDGFTFVPGDPPTNPLDRAYGFDGSTSRITVPASTSLVPGTRDITLSLYFKSSFHAGNGDFDWDMVKKGGYKIEIYLQKKKEQARCAFTGSKGKIDFQDGPTVTDGQWHHIVCKKTSAGITLTVDGITYPMRTGDVGSVKAGNELTIGWDQTDFFHGTMDDLQIDFG